MQQLTKAKISKGKSTLGHWLPSAPDLGTSALHPNADILSVKVDVC